MTGIRPVVGDVVRCDRPARPDHASMRDAWRCDYKIVAVRTFDGGDRDPYADAMIVPPPTFWPMLRHKLNWSDFDDRPDWWSILNHDDASNVNGQLFEPTNPTNQPTER